MAEYNKTSLAPLHGYFGHSDPERIARYKLLKDLAEGITRAIQMYIVWALIAYVAQRTTSWPATAATQLMGAAIFAYVYATPVLALLEFKKASPNSSWFGLALIVSIVVFWGAGIQALMFSDVMIDAINQITHPRPVMATTALADSGR